MAPYLRLRRLAYASAAASVLMLVLWFAVGRLPDELSRPSILRTSPDLLVLHDTEKPEEELLVHSLVSCAPKTLQPTSTKVLFGGATAGAAGPDGPVVFFEKRWSRVDDAASGGRALDQSWQVRAAAGDAGGLWLFGTDDQGIVGRRLAGETAGPEERVAAATEKIDGIVAGGSAESGPALFWRDRGSALVSIARRGDKGWVPVGTVATAKDSPWAGVTVGSRHVVLWSDPSDREWRSLTIRGACCPGCASPLPARRWTFDDPLLVGRTVTGLSAAPADGRLLLLATRTSSLQAARISLDGAGPDDVLLPIAVIPAWMRPVAMTFSSLMLLLAAGLIYFGFALMRERRRVLFTALGGVIPAGPVDADLAQRMMAAFLDLVILLPVQLFALETLALASPSLELRLDPDALEASLVFYGIQTAYCFLSEWALGGQTPGKRIVGIRVAALDGRPAGVARLLGRNAGRIADLYLLTPAVGLFVMMLNARRRRLGDFLGGTVVIQVRPEPVVPATPDLPAP